MNKKIRLFVDMDGTVAKFNPVAKTEALYEKGYFQNLEPMTNMVEAVKNIVRSSGIIEVYILSACLDSKYAMSEKNAWLNKYLPEINEQHRIFCEYGKSKATYIQELRETDVLLDDYTKNLNDWNGVGIKILNGINDTNKTWRGLRISSFLEPNILAYTIKNKILCAIGCRDSITKQIRHAETLEKARHSISPKSISKEEKRHER